jgi:cytochrome c-type biogenesis protein CcmH/NrfG
VFTPFIVVLVGAVLAAGAAFWTLRAARRAGGASEKRLMRVVCAGVSVVALGVYLLNGRPDLEGAAYASRLEALRQRSPETYTLDEALAVLAEGARDDPRDARPHLFAGEILLANGRAEEAARSFDAALRRDPRSAEALLGLAKATVAVQGGFSPEALAMFQQAGEMSNDPAPWLYQAMAAMEQGKGAEARRFWGEALSRMGPDDPRRDMARRFASGQQP